MPETWPFPVTLLPPDAYLVGGSVRDQLLQRRSSYLDLDFILPNKAIETASNLAKACDAGFVVLDEDRNIARVVFEQLTVDFAQQQGDSLEADLRRRDFTINAIAYHPLTQTFIDPLGGKTDIACKTIRMVSLENLAADPLRLMRGYRQAAQLGFSIELETQKTIHQLAPKLQQSSIERIRSELDALLSTPIVDAAAAGTQQLASILEHQLLHFCLPHFNPESIQQIEAIDRTVTQLNDTYPDYANRLGEWIKPVAAGFYRSWVKAAKLSCLVSPEIAITQTELSQLTYSRAEIQVILCLLKAAPTIEQLKRRELSRSEQFFFFKLSGQNFLAVALLALSKGVDIQKIEPMIARFLNPADEIAHAKTLITGTDIMQQLDIKPGPKLGKLIKAVEQAQAEGTISTPSAAIKWIKKTAKS